MDAEALYYQLSPESAPGYSPEDLGAVLQDSLPGYDPTAAPAPPPAPQFTDEDIIAAVTPGYEPAAPQSPASPSVTTQVKAGQTASASSRGYNDAVNQQIQRGPGNKLDRRIAAGEAKIAADHTKYDDMVSRSYDLMAEAEAEKVAADTDYITQETIEKQRFAEAQRAAALKEEEAVARSQARLAQSRANYEQRLMDFRAMQMNPNQLFQSMNRGDQIGTLASVFVADFLGAKGIKTSVMDTLNRAIDRNLDAQIQNIKNAGQVAEGFKTLWDMERAESASDTEARARMRTYMLDAMQQEIAANLNQFKVGKAQADGMAAIAKIEAMKTEQRFNVYKQMEASESAMRSQEIQRYGQELQASQHAQSMALGWAREKRELRKEQAEARAAAESNVVFDPSNKNQARWEFRKGITKEEKEKVNNHLIGTKIQSQNLQEYRELIRKATGNADILDVGRLAPTDVARVRALQVKILTDEILRTSGKAATNEERKAIEERIPRNKFGTVAEVDAIAAGFEKQVYRDLDANIGQHTVDLQPGDPRLQMRGAQGMPFEKENIEATATDRAEGKVQETPTSNAVQGLERPDFSKKAAADTVSRAVSEGATPQTDWNSYKGPSGGRGTDTIPAGAVHLSTLRARAQKGDEQALAELQAYAGSGALGEPGTVGASVARTPENSPILPNQIPADKGDGIVLREFAKHELDLYEQAVAAGVVKK